MNSRLDITTERGKKAFEDQLEAMKIVFKHSQGNHFFAHTAGDDAAPIDGFVIKDGFVLAAAEVKSRDMSHGQLFGQFKGEWLLTLAKLHDMAKLSGILRIPGYGFLYLMPSRMVLAQKLCNDKGEIICEYRTEQTETQATCNGGKANRLNAFIQMQSARTYNAE